MTTPESKQYSVVKSIDVEGLTIELIRKEKPSIDPHEVTTDDDGDDASTVCLEDAEAIRADMNDLLKQDESFYSENNAKLTPIVEEIPIVEETEEGYEGAAGLWAKDYQLPCFTSGVLQARAGVIQTYPVFQKVEDYLQKSSASSSSKHCQPPQSSSAFNDLMKTADDSLVFTKEQADCGMCNRENDVGRGIVLKDCLHTFCRRCLVHAIESNEAAVMMCPSKKFRCQGEVRDDEIKALLTPEAYEKYVHEQLVRMEVFDLAELHESYEFVENKYIFRCDICMKDTKTGDGIVLKNCLHQYCKPCLSQYIQTSDEVEVPCPFRDENGDKCVGVILDSELRSLVPLETYLGFLKKSLKLAEDQNPNAYHCKTPNCPAWIEIDVELDVFECPTCKRENCVYCKAVHQGVSCKDYQEMMHGDERRVRENAATENQVRDLIASRNAQPCPRCGIITQRIDGCRHMTCTKCRHEFQWMGN